jgi:hypothetical protein
MSDEPVRLTRQELFELVWSTPASKLAARFGLSDVALSKTCRRHDVPTPGRGYWAQLAAGQKPVRPKLPKSTIDGPIVFQQTPRTDASGQKLEVPTVIVEERLRDPHPAVQWLATSFKDSEPDKHGRLVVGPSWAPEVSVTKECVPRVLRILDAFVKTLESRGHRVEARARGEVGQREILATIFDSDVPIEIEEKLAQRLHELTKDEKQRKEKWGWTRFPKYDYYPDGEIAVRLGRTHYKYKGRKSVSDTKLQRIDDLLGHLVLAAEQAAQLATREHLEAKRREEEWRAAERRRLRGERLRWYRAWLAEELERMTCSWEMANRMSAFIAAYEAALPEASMTDKDKAWLAAARAYARRLNPVDRVAELSRDLEPSDEKLAELIAKFGPKQQAGQRA